MEKTREAGFTITELIFAIFLFALTLPAVAGMINSLNFINEKSDNYAIVNGIAEEKMESLRSFGYDNLATGTTDFSSELPDTLSPPHSGTYTVTDEGANLKKIVLSISYTTQGQSHSFSYALLIGRNGVGQQ